MNPNIKLLERTFHLEVEDFQGNVNNKRHSLDLALVDLALVMEPAHVHVFSFDIDGKLESGFDILDSDEKIRANRFLHSRVRQRFISSHALTRLILGHLLACDPRSIGYQVDTLGKPRLTSPVSDLQFSLSHSGSRAMVAVAVGCEVGIDIEHHQARDLPGLSRRFFHSSEAAIIQSLSGEDQIKAFFQCWTRKEAFVKGLGMGLHFPLSDFWVDPATGSGNLSSIDGAKKNPAPQLLLGCDSIPKATSKWRLIDLPVQSRDSAASYSAALAVNRNEFEIFRWRLVEG